MGFHVPSRIDSASFPRSGFRQGRKTHAEVFATPDMNGRHIVFSAHGSAEWPRQGPPPHLARETISGRRTADWDDTPGGVFRPGENLPGEGDTADIFQRRRRE